MLLCLMDVFTFTYLGLPLSIRKQTAAQLQGMVDKLANHLPVEGGMHAKGKPLPLGEGVLSAALVHTMLSLDLPDKSIHGFNEVCSKCPWQALHGGWDTVNAPKGLGGLVLRNFRYLTLRSAQDGYGSRDQKNIKPWREFDLQVPIFKGSIPDSH